MNENYTPIRELTDKLLLEFYQQIEKDLEEIVNAPSTINSIIKYYKLVKYPSDPDQYLVFIYNKDGDFTPVRRYSVDDYLEYIEIMEKIKHHYEKGLRVNITGVCK